MEHRGELDTWTERAENCGSWGSDHNRDNKEQLLLRCKRNAEERSAVDSRGERQQQQLDPREDLAGKGAHAGEQERNRQSKNSRKGVREGQPQKSTRHIDKDKGGRQHPLACAERRKAKMHKQTGARSSTPAKTAGKEGHRRGSSTLCCGAGKARTRKKGVCREAQSEDAQADRSSTPAKKAGKEWHRWGSSTQAQQVGVAASIVSCCWGVSEKAPLRACALLQQSCPAEVK